MRGLKTAIFLMVLLTGGASSVLAAADKIDWHGYESGLARGKFEKKKVFIYFYADWCTYCAEMDRTTFRDPAVVAALNRSFIPIRVDSERETAAAALFRVKGLPDLWFLAESGEVIGHRPGFLPPDQLMKILTVITTSNAGK